MHTINAGKFHIEVPELEKEVADAVSNGLLKGYKKPTEDVYLIVVLTPLKKIRDLIYMHRPELTDKIHIAHVQNVTFGVM